jgi:ribonucleoside-diphosphate reductase beta chain
LHGLASGTNWVFRDESAHLEFAFEVVNIVRGQYPGMFDETMEKEVTTMLDEAVECETQFAQDLLSGGVAGLSVRQMRQYLEYVADSRLTRLGMKPIYGVKNPFSFMELQDVQELTNFFERRVSAYQVGVSGEVAFQEEF